MIGMIGNPIVGGTNMKISFEKTGGQQINRRNIKRSYYRLKKSEPIKLTAEQHAELFLLCRWERPEYESRS